MYTLQYLHKTENKNMLHLKIYRKNENSPLKTWPRHIITILWQFFPLKGQVTFLKLCLLVVCLALIIPRFFFYEQQFSGRKMHLYACASVVFFDSVDLSTLTAIEVMVFWL